MKLWLDDERPAPEGWIWVKTGQEAIAILDDLGSATGELTHMSFDHDLADVHYDYFMAGQILAADHPMRDFARAEAAKEMTGYDVLLWMAEHNVWPTKACHVHTHNVARQKAMCGVINRYGPYDQPVRWTPYCPIPKEIAE